MYAEIDGVKFNITPNTYKRKELTEAISIDVANSINVFDEEAMKKVVTSEFNIINVIMTFLKIKKLLKDENANTLQKIQRLLYSIGPITLLLMYVLVHPGLLNNVRNIILPTLQFFHLVKGPIAALVRFVLKLISRLSGSLFAVIVLLLLLPISAFMTTIGSLLIMGDEVAQRILPPMHMKTYIKKIWTIFKKLGNGLVDLIPFARPIMNFISMIFKKIMTLFNTGKSKAQSIINDIKSKSKEKTEGIADVGMLILAPLGIFFMKLLKSTKVIGLLGAFILIGVKFFPAFRGVLMQIPILNKLIPLMLSAGAALAKRLKLNNLAKTLKTKQEELTQLKETISVMNAVEH